MEEHLVIAQKEDADALKKLEAELEDQVIYYEKEGADREPVENVYEEKIRLQNRMAARFNPFSDYGKNMLEKGVRTRWEFEQLIGPMLSRVTKNNINLFKTVLKEDDCEDIICGRKKALGAVRTQKGNTYGVGVLVYHVEALPGYEDGVLFIDWLFVHERFRRRNISYLLIGELLALAAKGKIHDISVLFSEDEEYTPLFKHIFGMWQFEFGAGEDIDAVFKIGDFSSYRKLDSMKKGASSFSKIKDTERESIIRGCLREFGYAGSLWDVPEGYFDPGLSCFYGTPGNVEAIILSHIMPSGMIRVEYIGESKGQEEKANAVICMFIEKAVLGHDDETLIKIPVESEEIGSFIETICPAQMGQYLVEGVLEPPSPGDNIDKEGVAELLKKGK